MKDSTRIRIRDFVRERDWDQYHNPKDLAIALSIEASELLESFLWKDHQQVDIAEVRQELADILIYAHMLLDKYGLDGDEIVNEKIGINEQKYPVDVSRGKYTKWNKL